jgi:hypothetical protein
VQGISDCVTCVGCSLPVPDQMHRRACGAFAACRRGQCRYGSSSTAKSLSPPHSPAPHSPLPAVTLRPTTDGPSSGSIPGEPRSFGQQGGALSATHASQKHAVGCCWPGCSTLTSHLASCTPAPGTSMSAYMRVMCFTCPCMHAHALATSPPPPSPLPTPKSSTAGSCI